MASLLSTSPDFDERLAVEDGQLATWYVAEKEGEEMTERREEVEVAEEEKPWEDEKGKKKERGQRI